MSEPTDDICKKKLFFRLFFIERFLSFVYTEIIFYLVTFLVPDTKENKVFVSSILVCL